MLVLNIETRARILHISTTFYLCKMSTNTKVSYGSIEDDNIEIIECSQDRQSSSLAQLRTDWKEETGLPKSTFVVYSDYILEVSNHYKSYFQLTNQDNVILWL